MSLLDLIKEVQEIKKLLSRGEFQVPKIITKVYDDIVVGEVETGVIDVKSISRKVIYIKNAMDVDLDVAILVVYDVIEDPIANFTVKSNQIVYTEITHYVPSLKFKLKANASRGKTTIYLFGFL